MQLQSNQITLANFSEGRTIDVVGESGLQKALLATMAKQEYFCIASKTCGTVDWQACLKSENYFEMQPKTSSLISNIGALFARDAFYESLLF